MYINCICFAACLCGSMDVIRDHVLSPKRIGCSTNMHVCTVMGRPDLERIQTPELKNNKKIQNYGIASLLNNLSMVSRFSSMILRISPT